MDVPFTKEYDGGEHTLKIFLSGIREGLVWRIRSLEIIMQLMCLVCVKIPTGNLTAAQKGSVPSCAAAVRGHP